MYHVFTMIIAYMAGSKLVRHWVLKGSCNEYFQNIRVVEVTSENESLESN